VPERGVRGAYGRLGVGHSDVDVLGVDDLEPRQRAELRLHARVALPFGELLGEGLGEGVQPRGEQPHPRHTATVRHLAPQRGQPAGEFGDVGEHGGDHLHAALEELRHQQPRDVAYGEHVAHRRDQPTGRGVHQLELLFDAHRVRSPAAEALIHAGILPPLTRTHARRHARRRVSILARLRRCGLHTLGHFGRGHTPAVRAFTRASPVVCDLFDVDSGTAIDRTYGRATPKTRARGISGSCLCAALPRKPSEGATSDLFDSAQELGGL
jgi:hypothetical protein